MLYLSRITSKQKMLARLNKEDPINVSYLIRLNKLSFGKH